MNRDYYKVLLCGAPGRGKTYTFKHLDPASTGFINVENKPLPFKNSFKHHARITKNFNEVYTTLGEYAKNPEIKVIVLDSFSAFVDLLLIEARKTKKGFDVWNMYAEEIGKLLTYIKLIPKEVFVTAHYEILGIEGASEKRVKVKGKEFEGLIEKEFTIVLFADNKFDDNNKPRYFLNLAQEGTSAKCPPDIFGEDVHQIPNDAKLIYDKIIEFVS